VSPDSPKPASPDSALLVVLFAAYAVWAASFIGHSSVPTDTGRYFCLFDDAMISLRHAWNFAHGDGLVFNPGERVEGATSFLFTIYMSLGALVLDKSSSALFVQATGLVLVLGVAALAHRMSRSLGATPGLAFVTAAAVLAYYPLSYWSLLGMETGLLTALSLGALLLALRLKADPRGNWCLGLLLGLMFATRPDAALPAGVILLFRGSWVLVHHKSLGAVRTWLLEAAPFAGVLIALTLFRLVYYGSPVPNSYDLKMGGWELGPRLANGWHFVVPFLELTRYLFLFALPSVVIHRDGQRWLLMVFALSVVGSQIWVGGDAWSYWRLLVPSVVVLTVLAVDGMSALARWALRPERPWATLAASAACLAWALNAANRPFFPEIGMATPAYMVKLNRRTVSDGLKLATYARPEASVAVMAAGALPYYSGLRAVDVLGKTDRHIARLPAYRPPARGLPDCGPRGGCTETITPGHNKYDLSYSIGKLKPDVIYDALARARYQPGIFELVQKNYVQHGSFWFRRDSRHIHWERLPPR
jgi:arabinofuranosyltransferase